ncbi:hypothetical protein N0V94_008409 [Neodidymelliopsis sp. IMI 364377]|nr:hypothetical protein N0V94_008409 [Neodidymelliopsis sp. IMI 364377]
MSYKMEFSSLSTLQHVTMRKLKKLDGQREKFDADKKSILDKVSTAPDHRSKVEALLDGFELYGITPKQADLSISNLKHFIHQAKHDPSVSIALLQDWQSKLEHELDVSGSKYEYAVLFGKLVREWIEHPNTRTPTKGSSPAGDALDTQQSEGFGMVGRKELNQQRAQWESFALAEKKMDRSKIEGYLNDIFEVTLQAKKITKTPLQELQDSMKEVMDFKSDLDAPKRDVSSHMPASSSNGRFTMHDLKLCIRGVKKSDLFTGEKLEMLVDLENQPAVLTELVDVLNMDLDGLDQWEWDGPVPLNMRRQLNGKYRAYMDEETHQAILLHFVGKTWAVALKKAVNTFYHSGAWLQAPYRSMSKTARQRREYFTDESTRHVASVLDHRRLQYQEEYFMTQLPSHMSEDCRDYTAEDQDYQGIGALNSHSATRQSMLRLLTTESLLNTKLYGEFVVLQSDFKWFGPSLPHDTIFAVMKFLGVPEKWLRFFKKFLEVPVIFAQDGPDAKARIRKCGIPISHVLSDVLSEAVLFCLDFGVNRRTNGANIHRFHDDLWFWGQESTSIRAWEAVKEFTDVMGLQLNEDKTGASLIVINKTKARPLSSVLPKGKVRWGFLQLDSSSGRWTIDRAQVDKHVAELKRQLAACRSVMAWVQAWNTYVGQFFNTNFAEPANCFGRQHNDMIIETLSHIQRSLFSESGALNVTEYLRGILKERFGMDDTVPDGFFYFPVELGGLGLRNPFINAFTTYKQSFCVPGDRIERGFEEERDAYDAAKKLWDAGDTLHSKSHKSTLRDTVSGTNAEAEEPFMSIDEYIMYREESSEPLRRAYVELLGQPLEERVEISSEMLLAMRSGGALKLRASPYWTWILTLYAGDLKQRFGGHGLQLGDRDLLPLGLVEVLKSEKVRWEG